LFRLVVCLLAFLLLAGAFVAAVIDGASSIGADQLSLHRLGDTLYWAMPAKFPLLQPLIERELGPAAWDPILLTLLKAPTFLVFALLGAGLLYLVRRRPPPIGFSSRGR
jgi:hypothetical protein